MSRFATRLILAALAACTLGACSPYTITGRVVRGEASYMMLVEEGDPRLEEPGIADVQMKLTIEPGKIERKVVAQELSGPEGEVALPVDEIGAGLLNMMAGVAARKKGFAPAEGTFFLPRDDKTRLLIVMAPGWDPEPTWETQTTEDLLREAERFSN